MTKSLLFVLCPFLAPCVRALYTTTVCTVMSRRTCREKKKKMDWGMSGETSLLEGKPGFAMDFNFFVEDNTVVIDEADVREQQG